MIENINVCRLLRAKCGSECKGLLLCVPYCSRAWKCSEEQHTGKESHSRGSARSLVPRM